MSGIHVSKEVLRDIEADEAKSAELERLQARVIILEDLIEECCWVRDVMGYPNGTQILNEVRANVEARKNNLTPPS